MKRYFYVTIHFYPDYETMFFSKYQDDLYINNDTKEIYRKRLLYDFGWGQETGFELMPPLLFGDLIKLIEQPMIVYRKNFLKIYSKNQIQQAEIWRSNLCGAVAVIMQDYVDEFVDFLSTKVDTDYFSKSHIQENFKYFSFDTQKTKEEGKYPGGVLNHSYEEILNQSPKWRAISQKVISQVYTQKFKKA